MSTEIKVGVTFLAGMALLALSTFVIEDINPFKAEGTAYTVYFREVAGLSVDDPVLFGGMEVGKVSAIEIDTERNLVKVSYTIAPEHSGYVKIREDSVHSVGTDLFGRAHLAISFGSPGARVVPPGEVPALGKRPTDLGKIMDSAGTVITEAEGLPTEVKKLTISLNKNQQKLLNEFLRMLQENRPHIKLFLAKIADIASSLARAEGTLGKLIKQDAIYRKADTAMDRINEIGSRFSRAGKMVNEILQDNKGNIRRITDEAAKASPEFRRTVETISAMLRENRDTIRKIVQGISEAAPKVNKSLAHINAITAQVARGKGLLGAVIMDEAFKKTVDKTVAHIDEAANEISSFAGGANRLRTFLGIEARSNPLQRRTQAFLFLKISPSARKEYLLGGNFYINYEEPDPAAYPDIEWREASFECMTFTLLLGWRFFHERLTLKAGAVEGVPGGVAEYSVRHGKTGSESGLAPVHLTTFSLEARALDKRYESSDYEEWKTPLILRAFVRRTFGNGLTVFVGGDNLLNVPRFLVGFRFEYLDEDIKYVAGTVS